MMDSNLTMAESVVPKAHMNSSSNFAPFNSHQFHRCFPHNCCPSFHWVRPSVAWSHAHPRCPNSFKPFIPENATTHQSSTAEKLPHVCLLHSHPSARSLPMDDKHNSLKAAGQYAAVQSPGFCRPFHPHRTPICPHHHFFICRVHGCRQHPCLLPIRSSFPPVPLCSMPRPFPFFPSMPHFCPAKSGYNGADLKTAQTFSGSVAGELISPHKGPECEDWNENGVMGDAYEIQEEEDEPIFVLTDEWMEFFAESEARRQQKKKQQQKEAKKLRKAERLASKKHDDEVENAGSSVNASKEENISAID